MKRDTAFTLTAVGLTAVIVMLGPVSIEMIRTQLAHNALVAQTSTVAGTAVSSAGLIVEIEEDGSADYCTMRRYGQTCAPAPVQCAPGWEQVCQGSCACGGTICQCVRADRAIPNTCGNGQCEPGEYRVEQPACRNNTPPCTLPARLIPVCSDDCAALARSGTEGSVCFDEYVRDCMGTSTGAARRQGCEQQAEKVCGSTALPACDTTSVSSCIEQRVARGSTETNARRLCTQGCPATAGQTSLKPAAQVCNEEQRVTCMEDALIRGIPLSEATAACDAACVPPQQVTNEFLIGLRNRIDVCDFATIGRCCQVAAQVSPGLTSVCMASCAGKKPVGDLSLCN